MQIPLSDTVSNTQAGCDGQMVALANLRLVSEHPCFSMMMCLLSHRVLGCCYMRSIEVQEAAKVHARWTGVEKHASGGVDGHGRGAAVCQT